MIIETLFRSKHYLHMIHLKKSHRSLRDGGEEVLLVQVDEVYTPELFNQYGGLLDVDLPLLLRSEILSH